MPMKRIVCILVLLLGCGGEKVLDPYHFPSLVGSWMLDTTWVDAVTFPVKKGEEVEWRRCRRYNRYRYILSLREDGTYDARKDRWYWGYKNDGFLKDWESVYWAVFSGSWETRGNTLRLVVEEYEAYGRWGLTYGMRQTAIWFFRNGLLHLAYRDEKGVFSDSSYVQVFKRVDGRSIRRLMKPVLPSPQPSHVEYNLASVPLQHKRKLP